MVKATGLSCGIVGLPNVGKSTLFNAVTKKQIPASNYPFCTIEPNIGVVEVPDTRAEVLTSLSKSQKTIYPTISFVDIAGLVKGAAQGEGLGNKFLSNIRETDLILFVVRCFEDDDIIHVDGKIDPLADIEIIKLELILADLEMVSNILSKLKKQAKGKKEYDETIKVLEKVEAHLSSHTMLNSLVLTQEEEIPLKQYNFLTSKPVIYVANVGENELEGEDNRHVKAVKEVAKKEAAPVIVLCAKLEEELAALPAEEAKEFLQTLSISQSGLDQLIQTAYRKLGLITFFTTGEKETRAWTITTDTKAPQAAGKIHTDLEKGFIRAEVVGYEDYVEVKSRAQARDQGKARDEGKEYVVKDGDVILFRHN